MMVGTFLGEHEHDGQQGNKEGLANTWRIKGEIDDALPFPSPLAAWMSVRKLGPIM